MGWTGTYTERPAHEVVTEELESGGEWKVIARSGKYYVIERQGNPDSNPQRLAVVGLVERGEGMVYTKLVDETMGPVEDNCPTRLLDLLPAEAPNEYAAEWRARCRANAEAKAAMPKLAKGDRVRLAEPIKFMNGMEADTFTFEGRFTFTASNGTLVRLPKNWKMRYEWERLDPEDQTEPTVTEAPKSPAHDLVGAVSKLPPFDPDGNSTTQSSPTVKLFTPDGGGTWFLTEYDPKEGLLFGLCDLGLGFPELGYVSLDELESIRGRLGLRVEVDLYWGNKPLSAGYEYLGEPVPTWLRSK